MKAHHYSLTISSDYRRHKYLNYDFWDEDELELQDFSIWNFLLHNQFPQTNQSKSYYYFETSRKTYHLGSKAPTSLHGVLWQSRVYLQCQGLYSASLDLYSSRNPSLHILFSSNSSFYSTISISYSKLQYDIVWSLICADLGLSGKYRIVTGALVSH